VGQTRTGSIQSCAADLQLGALLSNRHGGMRTFQAARLVSSISQVVHLVLHPSCLSHQIPQTARDETAQHLKLLVSCRKQAPEIKQHGVLGAQC